MLSSNFLSVNPAANFGSSCQTSIASYIQGPAVSRLLLLFKTILDFLCFSVLKLEIFLHHAFERNMTPNSFCGQNWKVKHQTQGAKRITLIVIQNCLCFCCNHTLRKRELVQWDLKLVHFWANKQVPWGRGVNIIGSLLRMRKYIEFIWTNN